MSAPSVTDEVRRALAAERDAERERERERERVRDLPSKAYFSEVAKAQDERWRARRERGEREARARAVALERARPEREDLEARLCAVDEAQRAAVEEMDAERRRVLTGFEDERAEIRAKLAGLMQRVDVEGAAGAAPRRGGVLRRLVGVAA